MKNDWQHNDANFGNLSESDLVDNVSSMESLTTYHKRNHFLLNQGSNTYNSTSTLEVMEVAP